MVIPIMEFQTLGYKMFNRLLPKVNLQSLSPFLPIFFFQVGLILKEPMMKMETVI